MSLNSTLFSFYIPDYIQLLRKRQKITKEASVEGEITNNNVDKDKLVNNNRWEDFEKYKYNKSFLILCISQALKNEKNIFSHVTESCVDIIALTEELTNIEESPEHEHLNSRQSDHTNISEETSRLEISESPDSQKKYESDEAIKTKESPQLIDVNDEIMENYDSLESLKSNGEVETEIQDKEKEKEKEKVEIKVDLCVGS